MGQQLGLYQIGIENQRAPLAPFVAGHPFDAEDVLARPYVSLDDPVDRAFAGDLARAARRMPGKVAQIAGTARGSRPFQALPVIALAAADRDR